MRERERETAVPKTGARLLPFRSRKLRKEIRAIESALLYCPKCLTTYDGHGSTMRCDECRCRVRSGLARRKARRRQLRKVG